ncbi:hypothetical protein A8C56_16875 [Niabella ginsenosidivorans]|uniref:Deoxyuridine 5'-triphosphate nucleotidohydrolase n=1 Tax=Niabella ginsenosidivorans TaxID=1176587 RepID=A0A1A9I421_9BACT|nr:DUF4292 domain-containing protein [Niabella ginsenosidivorans]ANH82418.1 hypothetical protein A8C56_16875 [Niabella ginsenosidivorans]
MKYILFVFSAMIIFASCNPARKAQRMQSQLTPSDSSLNVASSSTDETDKLKDRDTAMVTESISTVLEKLNHITYTTFSGKADVSYTTKGDTKNFDIKVQMMRDSIIWVSVTGPLGIEGARGIITKDSVRIINKLNKQYITASYVYLQEQLGLPVDLITLQDLLVGNPVFIDNNNSSYTKQDSTIEITSRTRFFRNLLTVLAPDYLPSNSKLEDVDAGRNRSAELNYGNYEKVNNFQFPRSRQINVKYKTDIQITFNYKSFNFNEAINTPFTVPRGYKKVDR